MKVAEFAVSVYEQLRECPTENLEEVLDLTIKSIVDNYPETDKRTRDIMLKVKLYVISRRMKEALN